MTDEQTFKSSLDQKTLGLIVQAEKILNKALEKPAIIVYYNNTFFYDMTISNVGFRISPFTSEMNFRHQKNSDFNNYDIIKLRLLHARAKNYYNDYVASPQQFLQFCTDIAENVIGQSDNKIAHDLLYNFDPDLTNAVEADPISYISYDEILGSYGLLVRTYAKTLIG